MHFLRLAEKKWKKEGGRTATNYKSEQNDTKYLALLVTIAVKEKTGGKGGEGGDKKIVNNEKFT